MREGGAAFSESMEAALPLCSAHGVRCPSSGLGILRDARDRGKVMWADRERGRFRAFLLAAVNNFMVTEWRWEKRQKRRGFAAHLSLDLQDSGTGLSLAAQESLDPRPPVRPRVGDGSFEKGAR